MAICTGTILLILKWNSSGQQHFQLTKVSFYKLLVIVGPFIEKEETILRLCVKFEKRLAIGLFRLATGNTFQSISFSFGVGKSTVIAICDDFEK